MWELGSIPGLGICPGEGKGYPLQYSGLENSMDYAVHGLTKRHNWVTFTFMDLTFQVSMQYCSLSIWHFFHHQIKPHLGIISDLAHCLHSCHSYFSALSQQYVGHLPNWGFHLWVSYLFAFSYCSWGSQGKSTEVVFCSLLQWTMFCQALPSMNMAFNHSE